MVAAALTQGSQLSAREQPLRDRLIPLLADGEFHSGEQLAQYLGVTRTAIWKALNSLAELGLEMERVPKRGYRLITPVELLDAKYLERHLSAGNRELLRHLHVLRRTDSTNARLLAVNDLPAGSADVCIAEYQTAGRGRRGRSWVAPFGSSLCLSVGWTFPQMPPQLSALSLAAGVAVLRALRQFDVEGLGLKWPNDLLLNRRKLGGILTELRAESAGPAYVVIGIGLNLHLSAAVRESIDRSIKSGENQSGIEAAGLSDGLSGRSVGRNAIAAAIIDKLLEALPQFQDSGFRSFAEEWRTADALAGTPVRVLVGDEIYKGIARGIDEDGALVLETPGKVLRFTSGEVSVRPG